jgi:hypothetical protein
MKYRNVAKIINVEEISKTAKMKALAKTAE